MKCTQKAILSETIAEMKDVFSSHEFIRVLMRRCPKEYIADLLKLFDAGKKRPLTTLHASIGKGLTDFEGDLIERLPRRRSRNLLGRTTSNQVWRKIKS